MEIFSGGVIRAGRTNDESVLNQVRFLTHEAHRFGRDTDNCDLLLPSAMALYIRGAVRTHLILLQLAMSCAS